MITLKSAREIEIMARAGRIVAGTLALMREIVRPGMTTEDLDVAAERYIRGHDGAVPSFKGLYGFPKTLCISIDEEIVHGIPSPRRVLAKGSIVSVDVGVQLEGLHADSATTIPVGEVTPDAERLLQVTRDSLAAGDQRRRGWGTTWATSAMRSRRWRKGPASGWCVSWWGTGSGRGSTRSRRCPTTARPGAGPACWRG